MTTRRQLLQGVAATTLFAALPATPSFASGAPQPRLVVVLMRGGVDGLALIPPWADARYRSARGDAALSPPGSDGGVVDLDGFYGLHPALAPLLPLWRDGDLAAVHATGLPYRDRSHFDSQNVLESGSSRPFKRDDGWLNRAVQALGGENPPMAVGRTVPLLLRGTATATSADPLRDWLPDNALMNAVLGMYAHDAELGAALSTGLQTQAMLQAHRAGASGRRRRTGDPDAFQHGARVVGHVLADPAGPRVAVIDTGGWDTHTGQAAGLDRMLGSLSQALLNLKAGLGPVWSHTTVLFLTEFGRTVSANGTGGTDHGTGSATLLAGGAVNGGKVYGDWPGLATTAQFEGRDLHPTTDLRAVIKGVLQGHLGVSSAELEGQVFPSTTDVKPLRSLFA